MYLGGFPEELNLESIVEPKIDWKLIEKQCHSQILILKPIV